jgi:PAS domain S-box-containing protein
MKLANKILLLFLIITLFFAGGGSYFVFFNLRSAIEKETGKQQLLIAKQIMEEIDHFLYERLQNIKTIGQTPTIIEAINSGDSRLIDKANKKISEFFNSTGPWDQIMVMDAQGKVFICTLGTENEDISKNIEVYVGFQAAMKGQAYYSDLITSYETGRPTVIFAYPIRDVDVVGNPVIGVAVGELAWPAVIEYLEKIEEPAIVHLFNGDGVVIGSNGEEEKDELLSEDYSSQPFFQYSRDVEQYSGIIQSTEGDFKSLVASVNEGGHLTYKGNNWVLLLETPVSIAFTSAIESAWKVGLFTAALGIIIILLLYFLTVKIFINPVIEISSAMKKRTEGDRELRLRIKTKDETGQMSESFNQMADRLNDFYHNLEEKVRERTEELNAEKNILAEKKAQDDAILAGIGDGVFVLDTNRRIILFNPIAEKISGFTAKEAMGQEYDKVLRFIFEKEGTINDEFINEAMIKGKIAQMANHTLLVRKDGINVPVADSAAPIKNEAGKIFGCVVVFRDVTKEREIDKMKSEFISVASHQLRTPLTGIKWFSELLLKSKLNATTKDYIRQISFSNERMVRLVDDLLNVSRIETGKKFDIILENTDIVPLIKSVLKEQLPSAERKHIALICAKDAPQKLVLAIDELKIRQVFQNLVSNAIKYSKEKTDILLGCEGKKDSVIFYVKDNGIGIPKHQQGQIFDKFFRAENAITVQTDGTGLGLYIVKAIVEAHGGSTWFESYQNKGSTFYVSLPLKLIK